LSKSIKLKQVFPDIFIGVAIPISVVFVLLNPIILSNGIPFYGDETYYYFNFKSFYFNLFNWLFQWTPARGPAPPLLTFFSYSILFVGFIDEHIKGSFNVF